MVQVHNLELALGMALKFHTNMVKSLKLKVKKFWHLIPTFVGVTGEKIVEDLFGSGPTVFKTFKKARRTLSGKISSEKIFRWGKFSSPSQYFFTIP